MSSAGTERSTWKDFWTPRLFTNAKVHQRRGQRKTCPGARWQWKDRSQVLPMLLVLEMEEGHHFQGEQNICRNAHKVDSSEGDKSHINKAINNHFKSQCLLQPDSCKASDKMVSQIKEKDCYPFPCL